MKEKENNEIAAYINDLCIKDELKKALIYFNEKITDIKRTGSNLNFNVIIDERSKEDIDILLENITNILEKQGLYKDFIEYKHSTNVSEYHNSVIVIDDFSVFYNRILDGYRPEKRLSELMGAISNNHNMLIITCTNKILNNLDKISKKTFNPDLCIYLKRNSEYELYDELITKYDEANIKHSLSYSQFTRVLCSIDNNYDIYSVDYLYDYSVKRMVLNNNKIINDKTFDELIPKEKEDDNNDKYEKKHRIDSLVGLDSIKNELNSLYKYLSFTKKLKINDDMYLNLFFLGNPGTGKTTVARMYAEKLYKMGFIKENKLIETVPNDLIGEYVGQTKETTRKFLNKAKGGVLFIDEAYLLHTNSYTKGKNPYMEEAVVELIKYLEDPKNVVIFAGYPEEMKKIYDANPGIKSRIYKEIIFDDYTSSELYKILVNNLKQKNLKVDSKSKSKIIEYIDELKQDRNFGNARSMLQLSQKMIMNHANSGNKTLVINAKDLPKDNKQEQNKIKIGFGIYD